MQNMNAPTLMATSDYLQGNRTWSILAAAQLGQYAVGAYNCYNDDGVIAVIRAAERKRSPAIIQLFPWTLHFQGPHFVRYVVASAHAASVPIAVHLDHCIKAEDVDLALTLPFDSIMIDASTMQEADNIQVCAKTVRNAAARGITIEVEMGRIEGGEDGLPQVDLGAVLTQPLEAANFMAQTGAQFLAPSFGNIHGGYGPGGADKYWDLDLLRELRHAVPTNIPLVVHGTHPVSDDLFVKAIKCGVSKINVNRAVRDAYTEFVVQNSARLELTQLKVESVDVYARSIERIMDVFGSSGKA